ncbi:MAG: DUF5719 family protein [Actinomycetaceae bacterium]|nr:DUF5719 family protein [Actinomycetaceae bacterium]
MTSKQETRRWTVRDAGRIAAIGLTAALGIAAMAVVGSSGKSLDFGHELSVPIQGSAILSDTTFHVVCNPTATTDTDADIDLNASTVVSTSPALSILDARALEADAAPVAGKTHQGYVDYDATKPFALTIQAKSGAHLSATALIEAESDEISGYSFDHCGSASSEAWFTLGSTTVGQFAGITIANPAQAATQVRIEAWDSTGLLDEKPTVTVAGESYQTINLATYFPEQERLAVHLEASGPGAVFTYHTSATDGLAPQGLTNTTSADYPNTTLVFAGFDPTVSNPTMRLANPTDETASVDLITWGVDGKDTVEGSPFVIDAGAVFDIPLDGLDGNITTVVAEADQALIGSINGYTLGQENEDGVKWADTTVWTPSAAQTSMDIAIPDAGKRATQARLSVSNPQSEPVTVTVEDMEVTIPPLSTRAYPIADRFIEVSASQPVYATVLSEKERATGVVKTAMPVRGQADTLPVVTLGFDR